MEKMKSWFTGFEMVLLVCIIMVFAAFAPMQARAGYFKLIDPAHPNINSGFDIHGDSMKPTTMLALVTHSAADGYFLIPGISWTPLAAGGGFKSGAFHVAAGPSLNVLPAVQNILSAVVTGITPEGEYTNLKSILKTGKTGGGDIVGSLGFNVEYDFTGKALTVPLFAGFSWSF